MKIEFSFLLIHLCTIKTHKKKCKRKVSLKGTFESLEVNPNKPIEIEKEEIFKPYVSTFSAGWLSNESEDQHPEYTLMAHPTINSSYSRSSI
jgi:hypothetical protein